METEWTFKLSCARAALSKVPSRNSQKAKQDGVELSEDRDDTEETVDGRVVLRDNFKALFERHPELLTFGEDTGKIGGVNQAMEGMQEAFGPDRVSDTGIRECTIIGQGIGLAMRGLRPIAGHWDHVGRMAHSVRRQPDRQTRLAPAVESHIFLAG